MRSVLALIVLAAFSLLVPATARIAKLDTQEARAPLLDELQKLIVKYRDSFPEITTAVGGKASYTKVTLNSRGSEFDAFRFQIPSVGRTYQLFWSIVMPGRFKTQNIAGFNILAANGDQVIFTNPAVKYDIKVPGVTLPEENQWNQYRIYGPKLKAGQEYLIWFDFKSGEPLPLVTKLRIEPIESTEPPQTPALKLARSKYQSSLETQNERYDTDIKAARRKYLGEIDRASKAIPKKNVVERKELVAEADRVNLGDSETSDPRGFHIVRAEIGLDEQWNDVTIQVRDFVQGNQLKIAKPDYTFKPDAAFGVKKTLIVVYTVDGKPGIYTAPADRDVSLPPPAETTPAKK